MSRRRVRDVIPGPVKRVLRPIVRRLRRSDPGLSVPSPEGSLKERVGELEGALADARSRIRMLKRRYGSDERRWSRQLDALVPRRTSRLIDLAYYPPGNWNAYARLLYSRCPEFGISPRSLERISAVNDLPPTSVFHLHWTRAAQVGTTTRADAAAKTAAFLDPIERFVGRGGTLIWTIHETLDHDCPFPDIEIGLRARLAELAHGIHVLHSSGIATVEPFYHLDPEKVFVVEHPLYLGAYQDLLTREAARTLLDLPDDARMLLTFGAIRPYKGFDRLVRLLPRVRRETGVDVRVMIAGRTLEAEDNSVLRTLIGSTEGASMTEDGPPDSVVHIMFRAADGLVLPYREFHNSGVFLLGLTFGVPAVVPRGPVSEDLAGSGLVHLFDIDSDDDLASALIGAVTTGSNRGSPPADVAERFHPHRLSGIFSEHVLEVMRRTRPR